MRFFMAALLSLFCFSAAQANNDRLNSLVVVWDFDAYDDGDNQGYLDEAWTEYMGAMAFPAVMDTSCSKLKLTETLEIFCVNGLTKNEVEVGRVGEKVPTDDFIREMNAGSVVYRVQWNNKVTTDERPTQDGGSVPVLRLK